jgi:hypothetical protein
MSIRIEQIEKSDITAMDRQELLVLRNRFVQINKKWWSSEHWPDCTRTTALGKYRMVSEEFRKRGIVYTETEIDRALFKSVAKGELAESAPNEPEPTTPAIETPTAKIPVDAVVKFVGITKGAENPERIVMGIVYEPDVRDSQGDFARAEEIRKAAFSFMESGQVYKINHSAEAELSVLESYLAPVDFDIEGQAVKAGSWILGSRVKDDDVWDKIEKGEYTGYSMAGTALKIEDTV